MTGDGGAVLIDPVVARRAVLDRRRVLLDAARLFSCAVGLGAAVAMLDLLLFIPWMVFGGPGFAALPLLAAASAGAGGAVAQYIAGIRAHGTRGTTDGGPRGGASHRRNAALTIIGGALLGSIVGLVPLWLTAWSWRTEPIVFVGAVALPWWIGIGVVVAVVAMAWSARRARVTLSDTDGALAAVLTAFAVVVGAFGLVSGSGAEASLPWSDPGDACLRFGGGELTRQAFPAQMWCWQGDRAMAVAPRWIEAVQVTSFAVSVILLLGAALVMLGIRRWPTVALVAGLAGGVLVVTSVAVGVVVSDIAPMRPAVSGIEQPQPQPPADAGTGFPGEEPQAPVEVPSLEEARRQFAELAAAVTAAAGPDAIWTDPQGPVVTEAPCEGGVLLTLDGEFAMGVITDTTTDEHDREVTDDNVAAAERIGVAWRGLGMSAPEPLHGEEHFSGSRFGSVEHAVVRFEFGVARPHIDGRCVPVAG